MRYWPLGCCGDKGGKRAYIEEINQGFGRKEAKWQSNWLKKIEGAQRGLYRKHLPALSIYLSPLDYFPSVRQHWELQIQTPSETLDISLAWWSNSSSYLSLFKSTWTLLLYHWNILCCNRKAKLYLLLEIAGWDFLWLPLRYNSSFPLSHHLLNFFFSFTFSFSIFWPQKDQESWLHCVGHCLQWYINTEKKEEICCQLTVQKFILIW